METREQQILARRQQGFSLGAAAGLQVFVAVLMLLMGGVTLSWA